MKAEARPITQYQQLIERVKPPIPISRTAETELDRLIRAIEERTARASKPRIHEVVDPLQQLRELTLNELVPVFVELVEKYSKSGMAMHMDASSLLEGGRELHFEFGIGDYRMQLQGMVTTDAIAFHEVRHAPDVEGQLIAGPMLRLKTLDASTFREFVCGRLTVLLRQAHRRR